MSDPPGSSGRAMFTRGSSTRFGSGKNPDDSADVSIPGDGPPSRSFKPQFSRNDSVRDHGDDGEDDDRILRHPVVKFAEERQMSAREAAAAQEAAEADDDDEEDDDDSEEAEEEKPSGPKQTMSLMDLLEETDRQMGLTGSRYAMDDEEEDEYEDEDEEEEGEMSCCVCHVNIKGATFTPCCGHTFCKLCSKELMAQKGHCPVCNSFVIEFLDIF
ncbi:uncharacterized protein LOC108856311 [Raphanus sativus]|uniref:Uncharacterized protein LOC108856311 n=1 Tax=Raphanus sativus TaxID=3726 RepID=A0A6J0NN89_RAPSA|nr:uncharacterized protein LOC108856311 [Raphanus sativus]